MYNYKNIDEMIKEAGYWGNIKNNYIFNVMKNFDTNIFNELIKHGNDKFNFEEFLQNLNLENYLVDVVRDFFIACVREDEKREMSRQQIIEQYNQSQMNVYEVFSGILHFSFKTNFDALVLSKLNKTDKNYNTIKQIKTLIGNIIINLKIQNWTALREEILRH